jgi:hypothetical protein
MGKREPRAQQVEDLEGDEEKERVPHPMQLSQVR